MTPVRIPFPELIAKKRDGNAHAPGEIAQLIDAYLRGEFAEAQMAAWLMAVVWRGLTDDETDALTDAMLQSGVQLDLQHIPGVKIDKHSTGGVGDKVSLCLAPLVAACGVPVPMISGRGLGHTGGTLDKLEAIPGFRVDLDVANFSRILQQVGTCMIGQTDTIAPADRRIYALRDITGTVESIPLIVASILSKKLAEGADGVVFDLKVGRGAFMKHDDDAERLARALVRGSARAGKKAVALLTDMDGPLGLTIGNALETKEAIALLQGGGPADLLTCTFALGAEMLVLAGRAPTLEHAHGLLRAARESGRAAEVFRQLIAAQDGDPRVVNDPSLLPHAPHVAAVPSPTTGWVADIDPLALGRVAVRLGAGRTRPGEAVDHAVGLELGAQRGQPIARGDALVHVHARNPAHVDAVRDAVLAAFTVSDDPPPSRPLVRGKIVG